MPNFSINDVPQRVQYTATSGQTQYTIPFPFLANTDIVAYKGSVLLALTTDYTLTGADTASGGLLTLTVPSTAGDIITIVGAMPIDRTSIYSPTVSNLTGTDLNNDFNSDVIMIKQLETVQNYLQLSYAPYALVSQDLSVTTDRLLPVLGANETWKKNGDNTEIQAVVIPSNPIGSVGGDFGASNLLVKTDITDGNNLDQTHLELTPSDVMQSTTGTWSINSTDQLNISATNALNLNGIKWPTTSGSTGQAVVLTGTSSLGFSSVPTISLPTTTNSLAVFSNTTGTLGDSNFTQSGNDLILPSDPTVNMAAATKQYVDNSVAGGAVASITGTANQINVDSSNPAIPVLSLSSTLIAPGTVTLNADPVTNMQAATKQYVDAISAGLDFKEAVIAATTTNLSATYNNGTGGVGATLTNNGTQAVLSLDGVTLNVGDRVLVKNQSSQEQNGIYTITNLGSVSTNWVLTRATDYDATTEIDAGDFVIVTNGTTLANTAWVQTLKVTTIGTSPINFTQFAPASTGVSSVSASSPIASSGGTTPNISLTGIVDVANGGSGASSFTPFTLLAAGTTGTGPLQNVASVGTSGQVLVSNGAGALPSFQSLAPGGVTNVTASSPIASSGGATPNISLTGTIDVAHGGTGDTTIAAYSVVCGGATSTSPLQTVASVGSAGQVLTSNGAGALPTFQAASGGSGSAITKTITQSAHGFSAGNWVYLNGSSYALAKADSSTTAESVGVVSSVVDANNFVLTQLGYVTGFSSLTAGSVYWLSDSSAGAMTATMPTTTGNVQKPLLIADSSSSGFVVNMRANIIAPPATGGTSSAGVNLLRNGNFSVFQRGAYSSSLNVNGANLGHGSILDLGSASSGTTVTGYLLDRWQFQVTSNVHIKAFNTQIGSLGGSFFAEYGGFAGAVWVQSDSASGTVRMCQTLPMTDLPRNIQSQTVTLSFVTGVGPTFSAPSTNITIKVYAGTGSSDKSGINGGFTGSSTIINATEAAWSGAPVTHVHSGITPSNCTQLAVEISWTPAGAGALDDVIYIWNMQLELGSSPTSFQNKSFETTLLECQPFYCKSFKYGNKPVQNAGTMTGEVTWPATHAGAVNNISQNVKFPQKMYGDWWSQTPTITTYNPSATNAQASDESVPGDCSSTTIINLSTDGFNIQTTGNASTAVGNFLGLHWSAESELT